MDHNGGEVHVLLWAKLRWVGWWSEVERTWCFLFIWVLCLRRKGSSAQTRAGGCFNLAKVRKVAGRLVLHLPILILVIVHHSGGWAPQLQRYQLLLIWKRMVELGDKGLLVLLGL